MIVRPLLRAGLLCLLATAWGCRSRPEPVARVWLRPERLSLEFGENAPLRFDWQPTRPLDRLHGKPRVFVHLLERPGKVLRTFDHDLPEAWNPGRPQSYEIDLYQSALGAALPAGTYPLSFGLYDDSWGDRWPLDTGGPPVGRMDYRGATVIVPSGKRGAPHFEFSGGWETLVPGTDQQILVRRWLTGPGAIRASGIEGSGNVRLLVSVPEDGPAEIAISNSCRPGKTERLGPGHHWLSLGSRAGDCEICFEETSSGGPVSEGSRRTLCLEVLSWRPGSR